LTHKQYPIKWSQYLKGETLNEGLPPLSDLGYHFLVWGRRRRGGEGEKPRPPTSCQRAHTGTGIGAEDHQTQGHTAKISAFGL
jgi:hypothetical protein